MLPADSKASPSPRSSRPSRCPSHPLTQHPAPGHRPHQPPPNSKQPPASPPVWARKLRGQGLTDQPGLPSAPSTSVLRLSQAWNLGDSQAGAKSPPVSTQHPVQDDVCSQAWGPAAWKPVSLLCALGVMVTQLTEALGAVRESARDCRWEKVLLRGDLLALTAAGTGSHAFELPGPDFDSMEAR